MKKILLWGISNISTNYGVEGIVRGTCKLFEGQDVNFIFRTESLGKMDENRYKDVPNLTVENVLKCRHIPILKRVERAIRYARFKFLPNKLVIGNLNNIDEIFIIGGDLYTEANKDKNWIYPDALIVGARKFYEAKKDFTIWGASIGPFKESTISRLKLKAHFENAKGIYVRENQSFNYVKNKLGLDKTFLMPDPAFAMKVNKVQRSNYYCVNLSPGPFEYVYGEEISHSISIIENYLKEKLDNDNGLSIKLVPHVGRDHSFMKKSLSTLLEHPRVELIHNSIGALETKKILAGSNLIICSRFHCSIAGFSSETPTLLLVSAPKGRKLLNHIFGNEKFGMEIKDLTNSVLHDRVCDILLKVKDIENTLAEMNVTYREQFDELKKTIK